VESFIERHFAEILIIFFFYRWTCKEECSGPWRNRLNIYLSMSCVTLHSCQKNIASDNHSAIAREATTFDVPVILHLPYKLRHNVFVASYAKLSISNINSKKTESYENWIISWMPEICDTEQTKNKILPRMPLKRQTFHQNVFKQETDKIHS
jgi:hypothetical protein